MKWNAFENISPAIESTKNLLFPFSFRYWMKLGFVSLISGKGGGGGSSSNINSNVSNINRSTSSSYQGSRFNQITGNAVDSAMSGINGTSFAFIGIIFFIATLMILILSYIQAVFVFIFIDALVKKDYTIGQSWSENSRKGFRLFGFRIVVGLISLAVVFLIFSPLIIEMITNGSVRAPFEGLSILGIIGKLAIYFVLFFVWILIVSIFWTFVNDIALIDAYQNNIGITQSMKRTFSHLRSQKLDALVYLIAKLVLGIAISLIGILVLIGVALILLIPYAILIIILVVLTIFTFGIGLIVAIPIGIAMLLFFIWLLASAMVPFTSFMTYFGMLAYERIYDKRIISGR
jgi:hypothetical protein